MHDKNDSIDLRKPANADEYARMTQLELRVSGRYSWGDFDAIRQMGVDVDYLIETGHIRLVSESEEAGAEMDHAE